MTVHMFRRRAPLLAAGAAALFGLLYVGVRLRHTGERPVDLPGPAPEIDLANVLPGLRCGTLDGAKLAADGRVFLWGWAYDSRSGTPARAVVLLDNGQPLLPPIPVSLERTDVVAAKGNPRLLKSGWNFWLPASRRDRKHVFEAYAVFEDGKLGRLGRKLSVGGPPSRGAGSP